MARLGPLALILGTFVWTFPLPQASAQPFGNEPTFPGESPGSGQEQERPEGRFEDAIETDRDSFTPSTTTVGRRRLIVESAYSFLDNRGVKETHSFPELLLRYGATERVELRLGWNYEVGGAANDFSEAEAGDLFAGNGLERQYTLSYGIKAALTKQQRWVPDSVAILQGFTPTGGATNDTLLVATYAFGWELPNRWKADASIRYDTGVEDTDRFDIWAPSAVLKVPLGERVNVHGEYFGLYSRNKSTEFVNHYFSPGVHYLITPDLEVGVRVGWGLNDQSARFFSNVGFGWRF